MKSYELFTEHITKLERLASEFKSTVDEIKKLNFEGDNSLATKESEDEKYDEAVSVVVEYQSASASLLQRRLGIGYNKAVNLIEEMEANGIVGPAMGAKLRKVLVGSNLLK